MQNETDAERLRAALADILVDASTASWHSQADPWSPRQASLAFDRIAGKVLEALSEEQT